VFGVPYTDTGGLSARAMMRHAVAVLAGVATLLQSGAAQLSGGGTTCETDLTLRLSPAVKSHVLTEKRIVNGCPPQAKQCLCIAQAR
jgi:hypothetical protein